MSTKIYNGFIINKKYNNPKGIHLFINEAHKIAKEYLTDTMCDFLYRKIFTIIDYYTLTGNIIDNIDDIIYTSNKMFNGKKIDHTHSIYKNIVDSIITCANVNQNNTVNTEIDLFFFSFILIPTENNKTLGISYIQDPKLCKMFLEMPYISSYGYWNNTDKPDDVSSREWSKRKNDWNDIYIPKESGLLYEPISFHRFFYSSFFIEKFEKYIITKEDRLENLWNIFFKKECCSQYLKNNNINTKLLSWYEIIEKINIYKKTKEYNEIKNKFIESNKTKVISFDTDNNIMSYSINHLMKNHIDYCIL